MEPSQVNTLPVVAPVACTGIPSTLSTVGADIKPVKSPLTGVTPTIIPDGAQAAPDGAPVALTHVLMPYMVLAVWASLQRLDPQVENAAIALGAGPFTVLRRIVLPQMVRHAIPGFANNWLIMVKASALVSIIGLDDMVHRAGLAAASTRAPFTFYVAIALIYLTLTSVSNAARSSADGSSTIVCKSSQRPPCSLTSGMASSRSCAGSSNNAQVRR